MTLSEWVVRPVKRTDRKRLAAFSCALDAEPWTAEVEDFIRHDALAWAFAEGAKDDDPRFLLMLERQSGGIIGVAAHERSLLRASNGEVFAATKLHVVAICVSWQGRRFTTGDRASAVLMSATMQDIAKRVPPRDARVFAVVHEDNARSIALCRRYGFTQELSRPVQGPNYRRLITEHKSSSGDR